MNGLGVTSFDELNKLVGMKRSEPFETYFAPMHLTDAQKRERIRIAERLEEEFVYVFALMFYSYPNIKADTAKVLKDRYIRALEELGIASAIATSRADKETELRLQASKFAADVVDVTQRHKDDPYYFSLDRARLCAEDQSNFVGDINDYSRALAKGYKYKTWRTVGDNRVRDTHVEVDGVTIPIREAFELAGGYLRFPHDTALGCSDDEICGCRCSLSFSKR